MLSAVLSGFVCGVVVWVLVFTLSRFISVSLVFIFLALNWKSLK